MVRWLTTAWIGALGLVSVGLAADPNTIWIEDFNNAKQTARQQGKDLLIWFTGSDWCIWCKRLDAEVLSQPAFQQKFVKDFVPVRLDFPKFLQQPEGLKTQNAQLKATFKEKYKFTGYPTIYLADAKGVPYAQTGYQEGGAEKYVQYLTFLRKARNMIDPGSEWIEDFRVALAKADTLHKDLLLFFTGSDWCPWCIKLDSQVLSKEPFKKAAAKEFVFVKLDYPRTKPQDPVIKAQNQKLNDLFSEKFKLEGFPTIYLANPQGIPYAQTGFNDMGPEAYVKNLSKLRSEHLKESQKAAADPNGRG
jgi:thioredoxin-related protein